MRIVDIEPVLKKMDETIKYFSDNEYCVVAYNGIKEILLGLPVIENDGDKNE